MTVANATPLNMIELLLKTIPIGPPSKHTTHKQHTKQDKRTTHHRLYMCFFNMVVILKGGLEMINGHQIFNKASFEKLSKTSK
jgi:hypothetical protein